MSDGAKQNQRQGEFQHSPRLGMSARQSVRVLWFAVILLCVSIGYIYQVGMVAIQANRDRTTELSDLLALEGFMSDLKDAESSERGYLLTRDDFYLEPYRKAVPKVRSDMETLRGMGADGNLPADEIELIIGLAQQRLADLDGAIAMCEVQGTEAAMAVDRRGHGEEVMNRIHDEISRMEVAKEKDFADATHRAERATTIRNITFLGAGLLNIVVMLWASRRILREVRRRDAAIAEANRQRERYWALFNWMDEGFCIIDVIFDERDRPVDFRFVEVNPAFTKQTGIPTENIIGNTMRTLNPGHEEHWFEIYGKVASTGEPIRFERKAEGLNRWFDVYAYKVGKPAERKVAVLFTDVTKRKTSERDLAVAQTELEHYARDLERVIAERTGNLKQTIADLEAFSYTVSHDLRSPLRAMQGFAQALEAGYGDRLDDRGREFLKRISDSAIRLDRLILEVLTYSRIGREDLTLRPVDMEKLLEEITSTYPTIRESGAEIRVDHPLQPVLGSHASLVQGVSNLLTNAVKFVPKGAQPRVHIWTEKHDSKVRLSVEDNGIGIPKDFQSKVFEPFQRAHPHAGYDGTGMGLAIVRKAMQKMGGTVGVESEENRGSTFWIELPAA